MRDSEQMYYDYDFRKMCNDWDFLEYEKKKEETPLRGCGSMECQNNYKNNH